MIKNEDFILSNGVRIPKVGYGTWQITNKDECINGVIAALKNGYRHIDTAAVYGNESFIKEALQKANMKREDVFITSKLPAEKKGYQITKDEFNKTIKNLGVDYLDLYLIHAPRPWGDKSDFDFMPGNIESWKAMEELYLEGKIKAIGVSNFNDGQLQQLISATKIKPMVNQIYLHIGAANVTTKEFCDKNNILVEAYCPLGSGRIINNPNIKVYADKYNVSIAQLCNRWCLQYGTLPLPKSVHEDRIKQNLDLDFEISEEDVKTLITLPL